MKKLLFVCIFLLLANLSISQNKFKNRQINSGGISNNFKVENLSFKTTSDPLKIIRGENDLPIFINGKIKNLPITKHARGSMEFIAFGYLESLKTTLKIKAPEDEFLISNIDIDEYNQHHIRLDQYYKGVKVHGSEIIIHASGGEADKMNGRYFPTPIITDILPKLNTDLAIEKVISDLKKKSVIKAFSPIEKSILKYDKPKTELIIFHENDDISKEKLAYKIEIRPNFVERWEYIVDAKNGEILSKINHTCALDGPATATATDLNNISRSIKTYLSGSNYMLIDATKDMFPGGSVNTEDPQGVLWTIDAANTTPEDLSIKQLASANNSWGNKTAVSAHFNAGIAYDYYKKTHNRLSLNGKGGTIISIINITETSEQTGKITQMDNAFWNGEFMGYGNGNTFFKPLAGGLDVAGHEMTHGVIENTANLNYQGQSGAINESMADVFGVLIDRQDGDFVVGEDVMKNGSPFLRSLSEPNKGDQPKDMTEIYRGTEDNGGVHINSGIPNRAFYLFTKALVGNEETQKAKAEKVYYRALTKYLTRSSKFLDLRAAIVQSCTDLAAEVGSDAVKAANNAFDLVGIGNTSTTTTPTQKPVEDLPTNAGSEFILSYDPCDKDIYSSKEIITSDADYRIVVNDVVIDHKPSVTDDGTFAYFISKKIPGKGGTLNRVNLTGTAKVEVLDNQEVWSNVAVSKDGKKLALNTIETTENDQKNIYIYNIETGIFKGFQLYNPTYSNSVKSAGTPLFSDALEWEYNGENVIYDAYNQIKTSGLVEANPTTSLDYWDVGILKAWDNTKNAIGDGTINKIFTNLAKNESIGNPSFAKRSTSVVAFDRLLNDKNSILTVNFESKGADGGYKRSEIANNTIGFPEFSAKDNKLIFNKLVTKQKKCTNDSTNTASISLTNDKVTATGQSNSDFIITSSLAVWYTVGKRELPTKGDQLILFPTVANKIEGVGVSIDLPSSTDKGTSITYKLLSGPASISNEKLVTTGKPGKIRIQGNANETNTSKAVESILEFCVNPLKPTISVTELANAILLQSSDDYTNDWFADGILFKSNVKGIEITNSNSYTLQSNVDGCKSELSVAYKAGTAESQAISVVAVGDKLQGNTNTIELTAKTDKGNPINYTVISGPAIIVGNKLTLTGQPGKVVVKGFSPAGLKYLAVEITFDFCVNPSKPAISITTQPDQYVFKSSAASGNNWYRNGIAIGETGQTINVVSTNSFTVQVIIDGCKSEFSDAKIAPKEILLAEEELVKAGISIYPNPVSDFLNLKFSNNNISRVSITNLAGNTVYIKENIKSMELNIDMKSFPRGLYILNLVTSKGDFYKKILKE